jgi:hypothetical protein
MQNLHRVGICSRIGNAFALTFVGIDIIFNEKTVVFATANAATLTVLQSRIHEVWVRFLSSTLKDDLQYTPSACFETFPFPIDYEHNSSMESAGQTYYDSRAALMIRDNEGLTKTYNRFHRPDEYSPDILKLRELHDVMDRVVLDPYGWHDLQPKCDFFPGVRRRRG